MSETAEKVETATAEAPQTPPNRGDVATFSRMRIPYHPLVQERFGVDQAGWRALIDAIWPAAQTADAVVLALSYCRARNLDPFKRPIHIVPIWSRQLKRMVESVWPGIGELRTTAFRTGLYAGRDKPEYGPRIDDKRGGVDVAYPEWCEITVYRLGKNGERMPYPGPRVYWTEAYATDKRDSEAPNDMWRRRPYGQIEKCAEAAALRAAFPEELGNEYTAEEMQGQIIDTQGNVEQTGTAPVVKQSNLERFEQQHGNGTVTDVEPEPEPFEVVDMTGNVTEHSTVESVVVAYQAAMEEAEKIGEKAITTVQDNNVGLMNALDKAGHQVLTEEMSRDYGLRRQAAALVETAAREAEEKKAKAAKNNTASAAPKATEQTSELRGNDATESPGAETVSTVAADTAPGSTSPRAGAEPADDDLDRRAGPAPVEASAAQSNGRTAGSIPATGAKSEPAQTGKKPPPPKAAPAAQPGLGLGVPADGGYECPPIRTRDGQYQWHVWVVSSYLPEIRKADNRDDLMGLLDANQQHEAAARKAVDVADLKELDAGITKKWDEIFAAETKQS